MFYSILSGILKTLGLAEWAKGVWEHHETKVQGMMEQQLADYKKADFNAESAAIDRTKINGMSNEDLKALLETAAHKKD